MSQQRSDEDENFISWLTSECRRLEAERDRLIEACVVAEWQPENHIRHGRDGFRWRYGEQTGVCNTREHAIREVRNLAAKVVTP